MIVIARAEEKETWSQYFPTLDVLSFSKRIVIKSFYIWPDYEFYGIGLETLIFDVI